MDISALLPGDIEVYEVRKGSIYGRVECLFTRYGHASIYVGDGDIVESVGRGAIRTGLKDNYHGRPVIILRLNGLSGKPDVGSRLEAKTAANRAVYISRKQSAKYDFEALFDYAIPRLICQRLGWRVPKLWRTNSHYICSELVVQAYNDVGVDLGCTPYKLIPLPGDFLNSPVLTTIYRGEV